MVRECWELTDLLSWAWAAHCDVHGLLGVGWPLNQEQLL